MPSAAGWVGGVGMRSVGPERCQEPGCRQTVGTRGRFGSAAGMSTAGRAARICLVLLSAERDGTGQPGTVSL